MKVLSLVNQKGGVAKTTTSIALADYFARHGKKTLLIDFDPQGSLTTSFGLADDADNPKALKFLALARGGSEAMPHKLAKNLYVITSDIGLEKANASLITKIGKERYLRRAVDELNKKEKFDYVILDSNPSFSQLTINVLYASDKVLVPFKPEFNSYKGIMQLFENIEELKALQPNLAVLGFVVTMARPVKSAEQAIAEITDFAKDQSCRVFTPAIRLAVACADAPSHQKSIYSYAPDSSVAHDYEMLGANVLEALEGI
ncbi:MAG: ParA family protein [Clostridia bacterium]|nr:ParA family protein [Clostridia bacterium]